MIELALTNLRLSIDRIFFERYSIPRRVYYTAAVSLIALSCELIGVLFAAMSFPEVVFGRRFAASFSGVVFGRLFLALFSGAVTWRRFLALFADAVF